MRLALFALMGASVLVAAGSQAAMAQSSATLTILNEPIPGTDRIVVGQGDPVMAYFEVDPSARSSPDDVIQLRRVDDSSVVSQEVRGERLWGTVSLDTSPGNALGELEVVYMHVSGTILGTAEQTVLVIPEAPPEPPSLVVVPSQEAPTIQAGIIAVADGGTVQIKPGVYEILQPLFVIGKTVTIQGAGSSRKPGQDQVTQLAAPPPTEVVDAELALGVINYLGAGGILKELDVSGSDACVVTRDLEGAAEPIVMEDVRLSNTGRGMLCEASADLTVQDAEILNCLWNGISFAPARPAQLTIKDFHLVAVANVGIFIQGSSSDQEDEYIVGCEGGGIVVVNGHLNLVDSIVLGSNFAGIRLHESTAVITDNTIMLTHPRLSDGFFGDGVDAFLCPEVILTGNYIGHSARAGVASFGSTMKLGSNDIACAGYELEYEEYYGVPGVFQNDGGNECGCPIADGVCVAETAGVTPPEALTDIK
jgi:hypothetical protein